MINRGANPHVRRHDDKSQYEMYSLDYLSNVPSIESIYFPIKSFPSGNLSKPFNYETGVYPGQYGRVIGRGGEGTVIQGIWANQPCAYKFVEVRDQKYMETTNDNLKDMNVRLKEMIEMENITGTQILKLEGHHRLESYYYLKTD